MSMGRRRRERQQEMWVAAGDVVRPRHVFYDKLNELLAEAGFDEYVESLCEECYSGDRRGRPSIPPGVYFRMLFVGYFEGLDSQRAIAWRCSDSLSLKAFLGYELCEETPDHSSLTKIRNRLPLAVHEQVFAFVLRIADEKKLLKGRTVAVDSTMLEANAAMKSIVRKDSGEDWNAYLRRLMEEQGLVEEGQEPTQEELRQFDKQRKDKKVSNDQWESPSDPDSRIAKMKDGRTHLAYKAEHAIDLDTEFILCAAVYHADQGDGETLFESVAGAQFHLVQAGSDAEIQEAVADKAYHKNETLAKFRQANIRTYIPERKSKHRRRWTDKPAEQEAAWRANRRRVKRERNKRLQRRRSERVERSFAHVCETGAARRTWLRGLEKVQKRYQVHAAARNLSLIMRALFGVGKPKTLQGGLSGALCAVCCAVLRLLRLAKAVFGPTRASIAPCTPQLPNKHQPRIPLTTAC